MFIHVLLFLLVYYALKKCLWFSDPKIGAECKMQMVSFPAHHLVSTFSHESSLLKSYCKRCCQKLQSKRYFCLIYLISFGSLGIVSVIVLYPMVHCFTAIYRKVCDVSMQSLQGLDKRIAITLMSSRQNLLEFFDNSWWILFGIADGFTYWDFSKKGRVPNSRDRTHRRL